MVPGPTAGSGLGDEFASDQVPKLAGGDTGVDSRRVAVGAVIEDSFLAQEREGDALAVGQAVLTQPADPSNGPLAQQGVVGENDDERRDLVVEVRWAHSCGEQRVEHGADARPAVFADGAGLAGQRNVFEDLDEGGVAGRGDAFFAEAVDRDRTEQAARIADHQAVGVHLDLDLGASSAPGQIPMDQGVDDGFTQSGLGVLPDILPARTPDDSPTRHVPADGRQRVADHDRDRAFQRHVVQEPLGGPAAGLGRVVNEGDHQLREVLLWIPTECEQASQRYLVPAVAPGHEHLGATQHCQAVQVLEGVGPAGPQPGDQCIDSGRIQLIETNAGDRLLVLTGLTT